MPFRLTKYFLVISLTLIKIPVDMTYYIYYRRTHTFGTRHAHAGNNIEGAITQLN